MFDPQAVINQAMLGEVPDEWQVFYGKRPSPVSMGCFFAFVILLILGACSFLALFVTQLILNLRHAQYSITTLIPIIGPIVLALVLVAGIWGYFTGRKDARDPDPLLVVTPEGFVEYFLSRHPLKAVSFAKLETIIVQVRGKIRRDRLLTRLRLWLELHYPDGRVERWRSKGMYGEQEDLITQSIALAFSEYARPRKKQKRRKRQITKNQSGAF